MLRALALPLQPLRRQSPKLASLHAIRKQAEPMAADSWDLPSEGCNEEQERAAWVGQAKLLKARGDMRGGQKQQFPERIGQLKEISDLRPSQSIKDQVDCVDQELQALHVLQKSSLVALPVCWISTRE